jgi:alkylation response protein AidB-like acyl-CoA dehydrogenase
LADDLLDRMHAVADDVLFAAALDVDRTRRIPETHWQRLADEGFYGLASPPELGGPGLQLPEIIEGLEAMTSGCLATAFTWAQHHGVVARLATTPNTALRDELYADLTSGRVRAGVAFAGVIPDPPRMQAIRADGGWSFTGEAPFVSGWGIVRVLMVSAGDVDTGDVIGAIVPAGPQPGVTSVNRIDLVATDASNTVALRLDGLFVPDDRVVSRESRTEFLGGLHFAARINGAIPLGLVRRCVRLLDDAGQVEPAARLQARCDAVRGRLDAGLGEPPALMLARAEASELAVRAASALVTAGGGPSLDRAQHAQHLAREATFTLVAAGRPELKAALVDRLTAD